MGLPAGTHRFGPGDVSLQVRTYREGVAARAGHDLTLEVTRWDATVEVAAAGGAATVELDADPGSLEVREATGGVKPLTERDRAEIHKNIATKVLGDHPIRFRSRDVQVRDDGLMVAGELSLAGSTRPLTAELTVDGAVVSGTIPLRQSDWGIKPYRGLMGALRLRDEVEIVIASRRGAAT